jgi:hypothetical protein
VQFFVQHGVTGLFEQGNYSPGGNGELGPLRAYVLARLLWNPHTDVAKDINEFLHAYYGQAAPELQAYLDLVEKQVKAPNVHAHISDSPRAAYLNDEFIGGAEKILNEAESAAENETTRFRVQVAHLPVWYVQLATNRVKGDARSELLKRFLEVARRAGIDQISEGKSLEEWGRKETAGR